MHPNFKNFSCLFAIVFTLSDSSARNYIQKGIGEPCKNRTFWSKVKLRPDELNSAKYYNKLPQTPFNLTTYLNYNSPKTGAMMESN